MFRFFLCLALGTQLAEASRVATITEHEQWSSSLEEVDNDVALEDFASRVEQWSSSLEEVGDDVALADFDDAALELSTFTPLIKGGTDGSCPAGSTRVSSADCPGVSGQTIDGATLSNRRFRVDCAAHFTPGEGCFMNTNNDVYATSANCASAAARGGIAIHFAVCEAVEWQCARGSGGAGAAIANLGHRTRDACAAACTQNSQCAGFDFTTITVHPCRLYAAGNAVRWGLPGHNRVYCHQPASLVEQWSSSLEEVDDDAALEEVDDLELSTFAPLIRGGTDGSCPAGSTRVSSADCPGVNGQTINGATLSNRRFRVDCAAHFTPGEGCFMNTNNDVYATSANCASAAARGGIAIHFAVCEAVEWQCARGQGGAGAAIANLGHRTRDACAAACSQNSRCAGFDFTTLTVHPCRLYAAGNAVRWGLPGGHNRVYCH